MIGIDKKVLYLFDPDTAPLFVGFELALCSKGFVFLGEGLGKLEHTSVFGHMSYEQPLLYTLLSFI